MSDLRERQEDFRNKSEKEYYAKRFHEGWVCADWQIGFDAFRDSPEYKAMKAALERIAIANYTDYPPDDSHAGNFCRKIAREVLTAIEGVKLNEQT